jgi:hypothetical protein
VKQGKERSVFFKTLKLIHIIDMDKENNDLYLKREVHDEALIKQTNDLIDEWEARLPYSPIGTFSQDTTFVKLVDHACFRMEVDTQVVYRSLKQNHIPDDGENCPEAPDDLNEFDVWNQNYKLELDFKEHDQSIQINDSRERITCDRCEGSRKITCEECDGSALVTCGKGFFSAGCGGSGQVDLKREETYIDYDYRPPKQRTRTVVIGTKNCSNCHASGQVKCEKCNRGLVQCDRCEGKGSLIKYTSVEQKEFPIKSQITHISNNLPSFRSNKNNPTSKLSGDLCLTQDTGEMVFTFDIPHNDEKDVLVNLLSECIKGNEKLKESLASGKVFRQLVKVYNSPVSEYFYTFNENEYSIFINRETKFVEDLTGPIAQESGKLLEESKNLAKDKKYLKAFVANQKSKTLQANNEWEIKARKALVDTTEFTSKISSIGIEQTKQLSSLGMEKSKQLFSKFFGKSKNSEEKNEG